MQNDAYHCQCDIQCQLEPIWILEPLVRNQIPMPRGENPMPLEDNRNFVNYPPKPMKTKMKTISVVANDQKEKKIKNERIPKFSPKT